MPPPQNTRRFAPNLARKGRVIRGAGGLALALSAIFLWQVAAMPAALLAVGALFLFFEAMKGWCVLRACRLKTPF